MAEANAPGMRSRVETARALAARLPDLLVAARRIAANVMLGMHGRRHPGPGESFWQFRPYVAGEPARQIDWRRSARDHHLYVREREWEASQTVWLWADLSPSMDFRSRLSANTKIDRAVILLLALAEMLGRGGERVGVPGLKEPRIGRDSADRIAEVLARPDLSQDWPNLDRVARSSDVVVLSDFLSPPDLLRDRLRSLAGRGANMHLLQIFDPAEETFPYEGRLEFRDPESGDTWLAERAGSMRAEYRTRLEAHRDLIRGFARQAGFSFSVHHTDRPAAEGLLFLQGRLSGAAANRMDFGAARLERPAA
ncbi:MAG: DUF58 domain-containing protein [Rhizobiales bacterium]|nr:DUF58 domain-containing protein [Hyphomicrobiales bacterium]